MLNNHEVLFIFLDYGSMSNELLKFLFTKYLDFMRKSFFEIDVGYFQCYIHFADGLSGLKWSFSSQQKLTIFLPTLPSAFYFNLQKMLVPNLLSVKRKGPFLWSLFL